MGPTEDAGVSDSAAVPELGQQHEPPFRNFYTAFEVQMKKSTKILLGLATLWPLVYMVLFFVFILSTFFFLSTSTSQEFGSVSFMVVFLLHLLTMLWITALTIFYIVNVFRNERVDKDKKVLWAVVLFMGNMIAMPIYWYLYIWKESPVTLSEPASLSSGNPNVWVNNATTSSDQQQYVPPPEAPNWRS